LSQGFHVLITQGVLFPICVKWKLKFFKCCNPSLGLVTKARAYKGVGQEWSLGVIFHVPESVGKCERMNLHTPKWVPSLGVGVSMDFWIFRRQLQGSRLIGLKSSLYNLKYFGMCMSKMGLHVPFNYLKHKLWPKGKLPIWLSTTKSQ
jgi:hypothetical protein